MTLLTPPGVGAIAVIRIAGPGADAFLKSHFTRKAAVGRLTHGELRDGEEVIDDPLIARITDTVVDINVHGGLWVVQRVIDLAVADGFQMDDARQSTAAIDATDELEAEVLQWLPHATTELGIRKLLAQPAAWKQLLSTPIDRHAVEAALGDRSLHWLLNPPRIAIIGPPNVGKSTLANQLFGQARSITADIAGTTRDWVGEMANIDGLPTVLIDTPGMRTSEDAIEMRAIDKSRNQVQQADLVIIVSDAGQPDDAMVDALTERFPTGIRVSNKSDLAASAVGIATNAVNGDGVEQLRQTIKEFFNCNSDELSSICCWTVRQREQLQSLLVTDAEYPDT